MEYHDRKRKGWWWKDFWSEKSDTVSQCNSDTVEKVIRFHGDAIAEKSGAVTWCNSDTDTRYDGRNSNFYQGGEMTTAQKFEDLFVWQKARELTKLIYLLSGSISWKDRSLADQIRRAAVSVMSNIAEGFERGTKEEFLYFLYISRGSCGEVRAQLYVALDQGYITKVEFEKAYDLADFTSRLLARFIESYKLKGGTGQRYIKPKDRKMEEFDRYLKKVTNGEIEPKDVLLELKKMSQ